MTFNKNTHYLVGVFGKDITVKRRDNFHSNPVNDYCQGTKTILSYGYSYGTSDY